MPDRLARQVCAPPHLSTRRSAATARNRSGSPTRPPPGSQDWRSRAIAPRSIGASRPAHDPQAVAHLHRLDPISSDCARTRRAARPCRRAACAASASWRCLHRDPALDLSPVGVATSGCQRVAGGGGEDQADRRILRVRRPVLHRSQPGFPPRQTDSSSTWCRAACCRRGRCPSDAGSRRAARLRPTSTARARTFAQMSALSPFTR